MQNTNSKCEIHVVSAGSWMVSQKIRLVTHWHFGKSSLNITSVLIVFFCGGGGGFYLFGWFYLFSIF